MGVSRSYFPRWRFFITETEMLVFRCVENGLYRRKIPAQIQVAKKSVRMKFIEHHVGA
jgi:hypothetical protein